MLRNLRPSQADADDLRRHSTLDLPPGRHSEHTPRSSPSMNHLPLSATGSAGPSPLSQESGSESPAHTSHRNDESYSTTTRHHQGPKQHRFSLLKFRHASDPQLSSTYAAQASEAPPVPAIPPTPTIITTSPTTNTLERPTKKKSKFKLLKRTPNSSRENISADSRLGISGGHSANNSVASQATNPSIRAPHVSFDEPGRLSASSAAPPAYGDESNSSLALPVERLSESSRSDGSNSDPHVYAATTTTHTISTTTTFFKLPRRKKDKGPLFPLPVKIPQSSPQSITTTPRASTSGRTSESPDRRSPAHVLPPLTGIGGAGLDLEHPSPLPSPSHSSMALTNAPLGSPGPALIRKDSTTSARSAKSSSATGPARRLGRKARSSTLGSLGNIHDDNQDQVSHLGPSRASTSTTGRKSFSDIFNLSQRLRQNSEPPLPRHGSPIGAPGTPGSSTSKQNSFSLPREPEPELIYPEREEDDTPASYLEKLEAAVNRGSIGTILCKSNDEFSKTALRKYMRSFSYFGESIDMAIRKMLLEVGMPKETQQIDRLLAGFADRYHECNPGIFVSTDEAYFIAFSILLLQSDAFNKNNKHKMTKQDYIKNTRDQVEVSDDILECFFDNISYTPFIHFEDDVAMNNHRLNAPKSRMNLFKSPSSDALKTMDGPVDPYSLILDHKLEVLRPGLKEVMNTEDTYSYLGTADSLDISGLYRTFLRSGVLQIVSARSRPDAFLSQNTITNPEEAHPGLVDIKVAKVGLLWRKDPKKKKTRSPWQEWGAILTSTQLYFFRDVNWIKSLMVQYDYHQKQGNDRQPVVFKPPLTEFKPDALMSTDDSVALLDSSYKRHKNAFIFVKHGGFEEIFLANSEADMNDWLAKLNYAATFRTAGVRMRGLIGANYEGQRRSVNRNNSVVSTKTVPSSTGDVSIHSRRIDEQLAQEIMAARRQIMTERIAEADEKLANAQKELEKTLRNARHVQVLLPISSRTREQVIHAAGRMSAKLKWIRVEIWRTKCHRDILKLDLEQEEKTSPQAASRAQAAQATDLAKADSATSKDISLAKLESKASKLVTSPKSGSSTSPRPVSEILVNELLSTDAPGNTVSQSTDRVSKRPSQGSLELPPALSQVSSGAKEETNQPSHAASRHSLVHQPSNTSSQGKSDSASILQSTSRLVTPTRSMEDGEERLLRDAGLISVDGTPPSSRRPDTASGSDRDRVGAKSPETTPGDRHKAVRRSLHRTLRDSTHGPHHPHHHRSKKGRDSNSSAVMAEDTQSLNESETLARGTGSFIVHGKKASVITFGSEWQTMSPEERLKLRKEAQVEAGKSSGQSVADDGAESVSGSVTKTRAESLRSASTTTARSFITAERPTSSRFDDPASQAGAASAPEELEDHAEEIHDQDDGPKLSKATSSASGEDNSHLSVALEELRHSPQPQSVAA